MDFRFTPEQEALRKEFDDFFREEMRNAPPEWGTSMEAMFGLDVCWEFHISMAKKLAAKGWLSRAWPSEYGGQDAPLMEQFIFSEVQGYHRGAGVDPWGVSMLAPTLLYSGNEEQKQEHLPPIARAEKFWTQLWSEPGAGSDLAAVTTRATRDGDDYIVNGQKIWTSGAHRADWGFMIARTNPEEKRSRGISFFLVDMKTPGITINPVLSLEHSHLFNEVFFDDVRVPARNLVGQENEGWLASQMMSNFERSMIMLFAFLRHEIEELVAYCKETKRGGKPLAEDPHIRHKLAELTMEVEAGRAFAYFIVWNQHTQGLVGAGAYAAAAKVFATELNQKLSYAGCQILGLYGQVEYSKWSPMRGKYEKEYLQSISLNMGGGTSEIMRNLVCTLALGLPRSW